MNLLFICSKNQWRSPTAEQIYRSDPRVSARSAGTSRSAKHHVTSADLQWADIIIAMEDKHLSRLRAEHPSSLRFKACFALDIPDEYRYMDDDLITELREAVEPIIEAQCDS